MQTHSHQKFAFTLAEILVCIGILGFVAAMTMPTLYNTFQKKIVEAKLQTFRSTMNNALAMAQDELGGTFEDWVVKNKYYSSAEMKTFVETYIFPYMKHSDLVDCNFELKDTGWTQTGVCFYLVNGGLVWTHIDGNGGDLILYLNGKRDTNPRNSFQFQYAKKNNTGYKGLDYIEPYTHGWNGQHETLKTHSVWGCKRPCYVCGYCTKLIEENNWKIPNDYPW